MSNKSIRKELISLFTGELAEFSDILAIGGHLYVKFLHLGGAVGEQSDLYK